MRPPRVPQPLDVARVLAARRGRGLVAVFDVDGTLAPIAPTPADARVPPETRRALRRLARRRDTLVGIVSGRPIAQVARLVGPGFHHLAMAVPTAVVRSARQLYRARRQLT